MCEKGNPAANADCIGSPVSDMADLALQDDSSQLGNVVPKCYPKWKGKPVYEGNTDALALTLCIFATVINYIGVGAFFATAILRIATVASICHADNAGTDANLNELCGPQISFIKPSSLLTFYAMVISSLVSCMLPFIGAIVDHTSKRLLLGRIMSAIFCALLLPLMFLSEQNYIAMLACHGCSVFFGWFVTVFYYAYLPELTTNELKLSDWSKKFTMWSYAGVFVFLVSVIGGVTASGIVTGKAKDYLYTARLSMAITFGINTIFLQVAWWLLFHKRDPLHKMPENTSLCTVGFKQLYDTARHVCQNYRALKWYYFHIMTSNSSSQAFGIIMLTYITNFIGLDILQVGIAFSCSLIACIPGSIAASFFARKLDPISSAKINLILMIICIGLFPVVLNASGQITRTYIYLLFVGFNGGWKSVLDKLIPSSIIPERQSTEMMGFFLFVDQWLLWVPLSVYTLLNEVGVSIRINVAILDVYLCFSLFCLYMTGSYANARKEVNRFTMYLGNDSQIDNNIAKAVAETDADVVAEDRVDDDDIEDKQSQPIPTIAEA